jgi:C-terminal processing protease CtpA/Prc
LQQLAFLTHIQPNSQVEVTYKNPGDAQEQQTTMEAEPEVGSLFDSLPIYNQDTLALPIEAEILEDSGLAYIKINSFSDDDNLTAQLWDQFIQKIIDNKVPGVILDVRANGGGNPRLANDIAGYFFENEIVLSQGYYLSDRTGQFEPEGLPEKVSPGPRHYDGSVSILVGPDCVSACEGFAYAMSQEGRATIIGNYPTAGAFGEVARGQYDLPDKMSLQFPTGRPITPEGKILIEGQGVALDFTVPVSEDSAMGKVDSVLEKAIEVLQEEMDQNQ